MNTKIELIWLADKLDRVGMTAEANTVDLIIKNGTITRKTASDDEEVSDLIAALTEGLERLKELVGEPSGPEPDTAPEPDTDQQATDVGPGVPGLREETLREPEAPAGGPGGGWHGAQMTQTLQNVGNVTLSDLLRETKE